MIFSASCRIHGDACLNAAEHLSKNCQSAYEMIRSLGLSHSVSEEAGPPCFWSGRLREKRLKKEFRIKISLTPREIAQLSDFAGDRHPGAGRVPRKRN